MSAVLSIIEFDTLLLTSRPHVLSKDSRITSNAVMPFAAKLSYPTNAVDIQDGLVRDNLKLTDIRRAADVRTNKPNETGNIL